MSDPSSGPPEALGEPVGPPPATAPPATAYPGQPQAYPQPAAQPYPQPYAPPYYAYPPPVPTNQKALISMILGLVGFLTWITSIPAIIFGHLARKELARTGEQGHGMALTGLITGYVVAIGGLLVIGGYILFVVVFVTSVSSMS